MPDIEIAVETTSVITVEVERTGPQGPGASVLGRALSGEGITLWGLDNGAGLPGAVLQARIDAHIAAGVPSYAIGWWSTGTEAASGAVSDSMGTLALTASATLALSALSGVRIGSMGALSLTAPATLALGTLAGVEVSEGSASLGDLSLTASSTLSLGTLSGVQNGDMGALGLTAGATLALGTLAGVENSGEVSASMGELALTASATLALGTLAGVVTGGNSFSSTFDALSPFTANSGSVVFSGGNAVFNGVDAIGVATTMSRGFYVEFPVVLAGGVGSHFQMTVSNDNANSLATAYRSAYLLYLALVDDEEGGFYSYAEASTKDASGLTLNTVFSNGAIADLTVQRTIRMEFVSGGGITLKIDGSTVSTGTENTYTSFKHLHLIVGHGGSQTATLASITVGAL